ncbi:unnamed protein product [Enterobius vermicularis]|uniref:Uncharacterized protein n=1 Tax=Enterobius vermicularis TaxID=51028 RepID=A0A0N4VFQ9_ENTVE|nr:unnamed protein product [Enterobius vermicularis]
MEVVISVVQPRQGCSSEEAFRSLYDYDVLLTNEPSSTSSPSNRHQFPRFRVEANEDPTEVAYAVAKRLLRFVFWFFYYFCLIAATKLNNSSDNSV